MVSFWPFKGDDNSAASFEKALSQLSEKIAKSSAQNDRLRQNQRRLKALWTLWSGFAYILTAILLVLVVGWRDWSAVEWSAVAGGPVLIYGVWAGLDAYYNYRISNSQNYLNDLYKQREATIEKLKAATKYNSTQQLLDKYGGTPRKRQPSPQPPKKRKSEGPSSNQSTPQGGRTGFVPPPTANIPGRQPPAGPMTPGDTPASGAGQNLTPQRMQLLQPSGDNEGPGEEFAPNAFAASSRPPAIRQPSASQYAVDGPKWYDRILDVVLGEDETQAKNRIVLICSNCKLVNGQAPPGTRTLEDVGKWKCFSCQAWNGVESEDKKLLKQISGQPTSPTSPMSPGVPMSAVTDPGPATGRMHEDDDEEFEEVDEMVGDDSEEAEVDVTQTPAGSTRSKARQREKA